ncbi:MarR family transcriptional regulator [Seminibacterium arietis]|uniref:MarR family transcriptional regulator n=1 Tax=Seminibacterium arietis TaxID=1173502 RepID=A0ABW3IAS6_9PAST
MIISFLEQKNSIQRFAESHSAMPTDIIMLVRLLMHVNTLYAEHRNCLLKEYSLNDTLFMTLVIMYIQPNYSIQPSKLSEILGYSRTNATRISDELVSRQYLRRVQLENDRRGFLLELTSEGKDFLSRLLPTQWEQMRSIFSILSDEENAELTRLLLKLNNHLEKFEEIKR